MCFQVYMKHASSSRLGTQRCLKPERYWITQREEKTILDCSLCTTTFALFSLERNGPLAVKLLAEEHNMQRTSLSRLVIYDMVPRSWKESGCTWSDYSEAISGSNIRSVWISKKLVGSKMASEQ